MRVLIATSLYEAARPYLSDWIDGVCHAAKGHEVAVLAAIDGFSDPERALLPLHAKIGVHLTPVAADGSADLGRHISSVRSAMLVGAATSDADAIVFCDADDVLTPSAIGLHLDALANADMSVGDLQPIGVDGSIQGMPMLSAALPQDISSETLADTNVCGFSNTAVRHHALLHVTCAPLPAVIATDWWVFAMLLDSGCRARRADGTVALYRQHADNLLGAGQAVGITDAARRLRILASHHRARGNHAKAEVAERLASSPEVLSQVMGVTPKIMSGPWHAEAASWCRTVMENV